jgi:hypothetical protein
LFSESNAAKLLEQRRPTRSQFDGVKTGPPRIPIFVRAFPGG